MTAFAAGLISFLSPCVLPLVPAYLSYVAGQSLDRHTRDAPTDPRSRASAALLSACFILGFSAVFIALGASASLLGRILLQYRYEAGLAGGALVTVFGVLMLIGLGRVPFLLSALFLHGMTGRWKRLRPTGRSLQTVAALVMVVMGVAIMTGELTTFSYWLLETFPALAKIG